AENAVRCAVAVALVLSGSTEPLGYGLALLAGYAVVAGWPSALVPQRPSDDAAEASSVNHRPLSFVSGASAGQLFAQASLTGGPVLLAAIGGAPTEVTVLFAGLALFRAPYTLALGMVSALTGRLTVLVEGRNWATLTRLRRRVVVVTVGLTVTGAGLGAWWGPPVMELIFGTGVRLSAGDAALVAVGTVLAMANLVFTVGLLARDRTGSVVLSWMVAIPCGALALWWVEADLVTRVCWTFVVIEVAAWAGLLMTEIGSDRLVGRQEDRGPER
ncbi:MAG: hypothetical protein WBG57_12850, partial [Ornithinimicrobium sp.]